MGSILLRAKFLLFFSGAAGLIYEVVWTRLFSDIVGSTAVSMTVVFSVFLLCLAIGAKLAGRSRSFGNAALRLYARIEFGIAFSALVAGLVLTESRVWIAGHLPHTEYFLFGLAVKLTITALIIGVPATLMGATVPVILNAVRNWESPRAAVTQFYGWNTLGAALGALVSGYFMIWLLGVRATLWAAIGINVVVGIGALLLARSSDAVPSQEARNAEGERERIVTAPERRWLLAFVFLSGFSVLGYEILWGRMAKFFLGDRTIAVTTLLVAYITCLGLGSLVARIVGDDRGDTTVERGLTIAAWTLLISAVLHVFFVPLALWAITNQGFAFLNSIFPQFFKRIVCLFLFIGPPTLVLGIVFPLLARNSGRVVSEPGRTLGDLYFVNTIGAAVGAAFACFALSRLWGTIGGFVAITGLIVTVATVFLVRLRGSLGGRVALGLVVAVFMAGAIWTPKNLATVLDDETLVASAEDEYGVHVLVDTADGGARIRNNRIKLIATLGEPTTMHAQQMMAHLPALLARECRSSLNVGTGYGITPGVFTLYDEFESIETVELMPFVIEIQNHFTKQNFDYLNDPRTTLIQDDGRHYLIASDRTYDVICVNVLDPYLPGSSALYTVEFWEEAKRHLRPGGVYNQLIWGAHLTLMVKGLESVFPTVIYFDAYGGGAFNVVAFRDEVPRERLSIHWERLVPRAREEFVRITGEPSPETTFPLQIEKAWVVRKVLRERASKIKEPPHSDNRPTLEYMWSHGSEHVTVFDTPMVDY